MLPEEFEFDPRKSAANLAKHGVDFVAAQEIWMDPRMLEIDARSLDEPRTLVLGRAAGALWSAVVTQRKGRVRIISVRRARADERRLYEAEGRCRVSQACIPGPAQRRRHRSPA